MNNQEENILKVKEKEPNPLVNLVLFLATIGTTLLAGALQRGVNPFKHPQKLYLGIPFSFTILVILGVHELGHYFMSKKYKVKATLPYFIPVPPPHILGTFGAIIKMRSPLPNRKSLFDIGIAGPLSGFMVALLAVIIGLNLSEIVEVPLGKEGLFVGSSLLFSFLTKLIVPSPPEGYSILLHPVAFAGWIGFLVTAINLFPIGQFDGGHIAYSLFGKKHKVIAKITFFFFLFLGFFWIGWFLWAVLFLFFGLGHPSPLDDVTLLDKKRKKLGLIALLILILSFVPVPFLTSRI